MTMDMTAELTFPSICAACGEPLAGPTVCTVTAGSAWQGGYAVLEDGAEMYVTRSYHEDCAPAAAFQVDR